MFSDLTAHAASSVIELFVQTLVVFQKTPILDPGRGTGLNTFEGCLVDEELAYACSGIATAIAGNELAQALLLLGGNEEQKKEYLGRNT
ncbi:medium-chain specific acyl-CoA dehydrogenase [Trichonephila clavipes]|nr:medium-chain specific acyl-CoA dehydrogenase [Trichonephila clavipes]